MSEDKSARLPLTPFLGKPSLFDVLAGFLRYCRQTGASPLEQASLDEFLGAARTEILGLFKSTPRVAGLAGPELFQGLVAELDGPVVRLTTEDSGDHVRRGAEERPDFRVLFDDGHTRFIEVKVTAKTVLTVRRDQHRALLKYAAVESAELQYAVYWRGANSLWTLVPASRLELNSKKKTYQIKIQDALLCNQMGDLGDLLVGIRPPLKFRIFLDWEDGAPPSVSGYYKATIRGAEICQGDRKIADNEGQALAWYLLFNGRWDDIEHQTMPDAAGKATGMEWVFSFRQAEEGDHPDHGMRLFGFLSEMYSRRAERIANAEGESSPPPLGLPYSSGRLRKLASEEFPFSCSGLDLWLLRLEPKER